jgi:chromate transporter
MSANIGSMAAADERAFAPCGSLAAAFRLWTQVSLAGIGGSVLQIAAMRRLVVEAKAWISERRFYHALGYCIALPGPETQQLAVYVGWLAHRTIGAVIAGGLFILPGATCMMALSFAYVVGAHTRIAQAMFFGLKPAILAVMVAATLHFARHVLRRQWMLVVAALAFAGAFVQVPFLLIVLTAGLLGAFGALAGRHSPTPDLFADRQNEQVPEHTRPGIWPFVRSLIIWLALWLAPVAVLLAIFGAHNIYTQISIVFAKVAMTVLAGDYAVVAYAARESVDSYHWLSNPEMQEAVALGEIVPGTIMIVAQFLGFIAAYRDPGTIPPLIAGICGGLLATWMTFIPCFLFILLAAPFIDGLRNSALLNSALNAVTAAAVGMIANLTVWFGIRTLFHQIEHARYVGLEFDLPNAASFDRWAPALFILAAIAVLRLRVGTVPVLFASSAFGLLLFLFPRVG